MCGAGWEDSQDALLSGIPEREGCPGPGSEILFVGGRELHPSDL